MRTHTALLLQAVLACSLLCAARPAWASIDAVDEPTDQPVAPRPGHLRPRSSPRPSTAPDAVAPSTEGDAPNDTSDDEPRPRPAPKRAAPPPAATAADGGAAPGQPAAPAVLGSTPLTIALPQGGLPDLLAHFRARQKALLEQDARRADSEAKALRDLKLELGFPDFQTVGNALTREGERRLQGKLGAQARQAASLAVDLSPGLPEAWWLLARADLSADGFSGLVPAAQAGLQALRAEVTNPLGRRALLGNLVISALWASLAALALALALLAVGVLRYGLHDFHHFFPKGASPVQTGLLGLILLAIPWLFRLGPFAVLASLAIAAWVYLDRAGRTVVALALALAVALPFGLGEVAARTAVSPLALDLWTAETDLDAEPAVARLTVLAQEAHPSPAVLAVLAHRAKRLGKLDEAELLYRRALTATPGRADLENNLGNVRLLKGDLKGAQALYESSIDHDPSRAATYFNLGQTFNRLLQLDQSQEAQRHALELDRSLIEQHMSAPPRANLYLIDSGLVFADVASLGSGAELASRGVRAQATSRIFGPLAAIWPGLVVALALLLGALGALRKRLAPSEACRKCGRPVCSRCDPGLPSEGLCGQCVNVFLRKSVADPPARIRKEARVKAYQIFRVRLARTLGVLLGGGGHIALGEIALGTGLLLAIALCLAIAFGVFNVLRAPEQGIAWALTAGLCAVLCLTLYLVAVRDLFSKTR